MTNPDSTGTAARNEKNWNLARYFFLAAWCVVFYFMFYSTGLATIGAFKDPVNDLAHGWVVLPGAFIAAWTIRDQLRGAAGRPAWGGLLVLVLVLALHWLGQRGGQSRFSQLAMILAIPAVAWTCWGRNLARTLLFPTTFLLFIIPTNFLGVFTLPLRLASTWVSTGLLNGVGIKVIREGSALISATGKFNLEVADPCSGMRSIFAIIALCWAYGFIMQKTVPRMIALLTFSIPLAVVANIIRLFSVGVVANFWGETSAMHVFHDLSGFITFTAATAIMLLFGEYVVPKIGTYTPPPPAAPPARQAPWPAGIAFVVLAIVMTLGMTSHLRRQPANITLDADNFIAQTLPDKLGHMQGQPVWYCHRQQCLTFFPESEVKSWRDKTPLCVFCGDELHSISMAEKALLPEDTRMLKRLYQDSNQSWTASVVVSGRNRVSIHRPEMCLPGHGYEIISKTPHTLVLENNKKLNVIVYKLTKPSTGDVGFVNFLASDNMQTSSHLKRICYDIWERSFHNRIHRWSMFTFVSSAPLDNEESLASLQRMLSSWLPQVYLGELPDAE